MPAHTVKPLLFLLAFFHPSAQGSASFRSWCHRKATASNLRMKSQLEGIYWQCGSRPAYPHLQDEGDDTTLPASSKIWLERASGRELHSYSACRSSVPPSDPGPSWLSPRAGADSPTPIKMGNALPLYSGSRRNAFLPFVTQFPLSPP